MVSVPQGGTSRGDWELKAPCLVSFKDTSASGNPCSGKWMDFEAGARPVPAASQGMAESGDTLPKLTQSDLFTDKPRDLN